MYTDYKQTGSRSPWPARLYAAGVFILLLHYLVLLINFQEPYLTPWWVLTAQVVIAGFGIILGRMWKKKTFWVLAAYLALMFCRIWFDDPTHLTNENYAPQMLFHGVWVFGACHSLAYVLDKKQLTSFIRLFAAVWTIGFTAHCLLALYGAWTGKIIWNSSHGSFWGFSKGLGGGNTGYNELNATGSGQGVRLQVIFWCTISGAIASVSGMIALCGAVCEKKIVLRVLYILCLIPLIFTMGLTDTRASHISFSAGAGAITAILLIRLLRRRYSRIHGDSSPGKGRVLGWWITAGSLGGAAMVLGILLIGHTPQLFTQLHTRSGILIPTAFAETQDSADFIVSSRGYSGNLNGVLSGRIYIWEYVLRYIKEHPTTLLTGESIWIPMRGPNAQTGLGFLAGHPHNAIIWIVLLNGIPGLLLVSVPAFQTVFRSVRLVNSQKTPLWLAVIPAIVFSIFVGDLVETISGLLGFPYPNCSILLLCVSIIGFFGVKDKSAAPETL